MHSKIIPPSEKWTVDLRCEKCQTHIGTIDYTQGDATFYEAIPKCAFYCERCAYHIKTKLKDEF